MDLLGRPDRREPGVPAAFGAGARRPLVQGVGDDLAAVVERHAVASGARRGRRSRRRHASASRRRPSSWSPTWTSPIVVQPDGVGSGVSSARALPMAGRAARTIICPGCRPLVSRSRSENPVGHADHALAAVAGGLDLVDRAADDVAEDQVVLRRPPLGDGVDLGLRVVDDLVDVAAVGAVAELDDAGAGLDELAQHGPLAHDPRVVAGVRGGGDRRDERVQVRGAADALDLAALGQLVGDGDGVGRLAAAVQVDDRVVHDLVRRAVEVGAADLLDDVGDRVLGDHHAAEHAALGVEVLRRGAVVAAATAVGARRRAVLEVLDRHLIPIVVIRTHVPWGV